MNNAKFDPMSMIGSDELSEDQLKDQDVYAEQVTKVLESAAQASDDARKWLNTPLGKAVRLAIQNNKGVAMQAAATAKTEDGRIEAQKDFAVWCNVESIFGAIISEGVEALKQLTLAADSYNLDEDIDHG